MLFRHEEAEALHRPAHAGLDLDREHPVAVLQHEVHFCRRVCRFAMPVVEFRTVPHRHVRGNLQCGVNLGKRTLVGEGCVVDGDKFLQVEAENPLMESRVGEKRLEVGFVDCRPKREPVRARMVNLDDKSGLDEKFKRFPDRRGLRFTIDAGAHELAAGLERNGAERFGESRERNAAAILCEVVLKDKNEVVKRVHRREKVVARGIKGYDLRHSADGHVGAQMCDESAVERFVQRVREVGGVHHLHKGFFANAAEEFREGHRVHESRREPSDAERGNFLERKFEKRPGGDDVKTGHLLFEIAQGGKRAGASLCLVKEEKRFARQDGCVRICGKLFGNRLGRKRPVKESGRFGVFVKVHFGEVLEMLCKFAD